MTFNLGLLRGLMALEIGGPSSLFRTSLPVYDVLAFVDYVDYQPKPQNKWTCCASDLSVVPDESYGVILCSHTLEHIANPIRAITHWRQILTTPGYALVVVPKHEKTFDHRRSVTTLDHLIRDGMIHTEEDDLTHLPEILNLHDLSLDPTAGTFDSFAKRSLQNFNNRYLHHHVFNAALLRDLFEYLNFTVIQFDFLPPYHIVGLFQK